MGNSLYVIVMKRIDFISRCSWGTRANDDAQTITHKHSLCRLG